MAPRALPFAPVFVLFVQASVLPPQLALGLGVAQDRAEAIRWYRLAAAQGHADAAAALIRLRA